LTPRPSDEVAAAALPSQDLIEFEAIR